MCSQRLQEINVSLFVIHIIIQEKLYSSTFKHSCTQIFWGALISLQTPKNQSKERNTKKHCTPYGSSVYTSYISLLLFFPSEYNNTVLPKRPSPNTWRTRRFLLIYKLLIHIIINLSVYLLYSFSSSTPKKSASRLESPEICGSENDRNRTYVRASPLIVFFFSSSSPPVVINTLVGSLCSVRWLKNCLSHRSWYIDSSLLASYLLYYPCDGCVNSLSTDL